MRAIASTIKRIFLLFLKNIFLAAADIVARWNGGDVSHGSFPVDVNGKLWFSRILFSEDKTGYCAMFYKRRWERRPLGLQEREHLPVEICFAERFKDFARLRAAQDLHIPVALKPRRALFCFSKVTIQVPLFRRARASKHDRGEPPSAT